MKRLSMFLRNQGGVGIAALSLTLFAITASGCGGGGDSSSPSASPSPVPTASPAPDPSPSPTPIPAPTLSLTADAQDLLLGQSTRLVWSSQNASVVAESNFEAADLAGEKIVAPAVTTTYSLSVQSADGRTAVGVIEVRVATVGISVNPPSAIVDVSSPLTFAAPVSGAVDTGVTWSVDETGGGTVTVAGVYNAPATAGIYHIRATSNADTTKSVVAEVRVRAAGGTITVN